MASPGVPATDGLPPELLEAILGFLDVRTLCTARLVCAQFRGAASRCIHSVDLSAETLRWRPETTLNNFPNLSRVSVYGVEDVDLVMLAQSPVAAAVTHVRARSYLRQEPAQIATGFPLVPLPNLTSLTLGCAHDGALLFPPTLRELIIEAAVDFQTAELVAGLTNLTCLHIDVHEMRKPFEAVTALSALQRLEICGALSLIPFVAELTLLTHLQFLVKELWWADPPDLALLASLSRLRRLEHLGVIHSGPTGASMECQVLAGVATFNSLRSLDLKLCRAPERSGFETVCMTPFSRLTALRLESDDLDAPFLPRFDLEKLRDLRLSRWVDLDRDGVAALRRATGLTHLELWIKTAGTSVGPEEWGRALSRMSRLRELSMGAADACEATGSLQAVALLTGLTRLDLSGEGVATNAGGKMCLGLNKLRVVSMSVPYYLMAPSDRLTPETLCAIAQLPELCKLDIIGNVGISGRGVTDDVRARLNAERHGKGWPPLDLRVSLLGRSHKL